MFKLRPLALIAAVCAVAALSARAALSPSASEDTVPVTPEEYRRGGDFTYLTYPEWFLVFSSREYADHTKGHPPSTFPYRKHVDQFRSSYNAVGRAASQKHGFNPSYHVMIWVIGVSTTVEYVAKLGYEVLVGRLSETDDVSRWTPEDRLAAEQAAEYARLLDTKPWYDYDFLRALRRLWAETPAWGPRMWRKWDRRYFLTTEYLFKALYAGVLRLGSEGVFGEEKPVTAVLLDKMPDDPASIHAEMKKLADMPDGKVLVALPRYRPFTDCVEALSRRGVTMYEIAGNVGPILVSAVVADDFDEAGLNVLVRQPILTRPGSRRVVVAVPVAELAALLGRYPRETWRTEHVFDF